MSTVCLVYGILYYTELLFFLYQRPLKAHCSLEDGPENRRYSVFYRYKPIGESMWYAVLWRACRARGTRWHVNYNTSFFVLYYFSRSCVSSVVSIVGWIAWCCGHVTVVCSVTPKGLWLISTWGVQSRRRELLKAEAGTGMCTICWWRSFSS
jgi:hypothetical protein